MKEFIKRLGSISLSFLKNAGLLALITIGISLGYGILVAIPSALIDYYTQFNGLWWSVLVVLGLLVFATWDIITEKVKWLIEPLKNKKEEDVE